MARWSEATGGGEHPSPARGGIEQRPERLRSGGTGGPIGLTVAILAILAVLVWQPWGRANLATPPSPAPSTPAIASPPVVAVASPTIAPASEPRRAPDGTFIYASLVDNEWTVVALLAPPVRSSTEEPAAQHPAPSAGPPSGPFLVLQQGLLPVSQPIGGTRHPDLACEGSAAARDRTGVPLPAGRVAYLGVTFPGMDPLTRVTPFIHGPPSPTRASLGRVQNVVVPLAGLAFGRLYTVPSTGIGGAVLFAPTPPGILPSGTYRFDVGGSGVAGHRYLYACIGP